MRQLTNASSAVVLARSYEPFGQVMEQVGGGQSVFGYTGEQTDPTGLVFLRARYYNPAVGRFLTGDSVIPDPLRSIGWNRYTYVYNNPIRYIDPSGLCGETPLESDGETVLDDPCEGGPRSSSPAGGGFGGGRGGASGVGSGSAGTPSTGSGVSGSTSNLPIKYDPHFALRQGANPQTVVPDNYCVVRGGQSPMPPPGTTFSGSTGATVFEAGSGVPHGSIRVTTAGYIRAGGGIVELVPELTRSGTINFRHVNVTERSSTVFGEIINNPIPKDQRIR